jgi:hypothetical protein
MHPGAWPPICATWEWLCDFIVVSCASSKSASALLKGV